MESQRDRLNRMEANARGRLAMLAKRFADPETPDREIILAGLEIERLLIDACRTYRWLTTIRRGKPHP